MWVTVRTFDGSKKTIISNLSKLTKIEELRLKIEEEFGAPPSHQHLYYGGKLLVDGHSLFDYNIGFDQTIQLMIRAPLNKPEDKNDVNPSLNCNNKENIPLTPESATSSKDLTESEFFKVGDLIDAKDFVHGAWFEGKITGIKSFNDKNKMKITQKKNDLLVNICLDSVTNATKDNADNLLYIVVYEDYEEEGPVELPSKCIRPRARKIIKFDDVSIGDMVMVNYNIDEPTERGYWYDFIVGEKKSMKSSKLLVGTILVGMDHVKYEKCIIKFVEQEIYAIEKTVPLTERKEELIENMELRQVNTEPTCKFCNNRVTRNCKHCGCHVCGKKDSPAQQLMCDECNYAYHIWCLNPPLSCIPDEEDWYCPSCKNDANEVVKPGEKLKESKKRKQMPSATTSSSRDWGKGMACAGRTKECTIVPPHHFGPIPGVEVGTMWKFRLQVSEAGIHRPLVAGISGSSKSGSYSIVLSGGYEDDKDDGEEFTYTGSGGRSLDGNKRTAEQSCDQTLTRFNLALARNCAVRLNMNGAEAEDWRKGKPVRVVRNYKGHAHSEYCPEEGNRYDGIYKIVKYWPEKGKSGFIVWRYLLRRDDNNPAPWTEAGKKRSKELGLTIQYPPGYLESQAEKEKKKRKNKNLQESSDEDIDNDNNNQPSKKIKLNYELPKEISDKIKQDSLNDKLWKECLVKVSEGKIKFLDEVKVQFECICCQDLVLNPITTECSHNVCQTCLKRSFNAKVYSCPMCRKELSKTCILHINEVLRDILLALFPGYNTAK